MSPCFEVGRRYCGKRQNIGDWICRYSIKAIENNETNVMKVLQDGVYKTISLSDFFNAGKHQKDPKIIGAMTSNRYVEPDDILLQIASDSGIYIGEKRK